MKLLVNKIKTPDGTILESRSRYDYKEYQDANGKSYCIDGGLDYARMSYNGDEVDLSVKVGVAHFIAREVTTWGTFGKCGKLPLHYVKVADMETGHIEAVLGQQINVYEQIKKVMLDELEFRGVEFDFKACIAEHDRLREAYYKRLLEEIYEQK